MDDVNEIEQRIAKRLGSLPDKFLMLLSETKDQLAYWYQLQETYSWVEKAWTARVRGEDDPLRPLLKTGELSQNDYNRLWQLVEYYQRLWTLVQLSEPFVQEELKRVGISYPFSCAYELFVCIVQEQVNGQFRVCLAPYQEFSATKNRKELNLLAQHCRGESLTEREKNSLKPTLFGISDFVWSLLLLAVATKKATRSRAALKNALNSFYEGVAQVFELEGTYYRKEGSHAWIKGDRVKGSRDSTYRKQSS